MKNVALFLCFMLLLFSCVRAVHLVLQYDNRIPTDNLKVWFSQVVEELNDLFGSEPDVNVLLKVEKKTGIERRGWMRAKGRFYEIHISDPTTLYETLRHELMHLYLDAWARSKGIRVPLWVHEGLANWFEALETRQSRMIVFAGKAPIVDPLSYEYYPEDRKLLGSYYFYITDFFFMLDRVYGFHDEFGTLLKYFAKTGDFRKALERLKNVNFESVHSTWLLKERFLVFLGWIVRWGLWMVSALLLMGIALRVYIKRRRLLYEESGDSGSDWIDREANDRGDFTA